MELGADRSLIALDGKAGGFDADGVAFGVRAAETAETVGTEASGVTFGVGGLEAPEAVGPHACGVAFGVRRFVSAEAIRFHACRVPVGVGDAIAVINAGLVLGVGGGAR